MRGLCIRDFPMRFVFDVEETDTGFSFKTTTKWWKQQALTPDQAAALTEYALYKHGIKLEAW